MNIKDKILNLLSAEKLTVISTVGPGSQPESALVAFVEDDSLNIYFQTGKDTRKFANLLINHHVAFVIGFGRVTVQYEGVANRIENEQHIKRVKEKFTAKNSPTTNRFLSRPEVSFFEVKPTWIGYSDYRAPKPFVAELEFRPHQ